MAALLGVLSGCPDKKDAPGDERLLQRLQAEKERVANGGSVVGPPAAKKPASAEAEPEVSPLAKLVEKRDPSATRILPMSGSKPASFRGGTVRVVSLEATHSVGEQIAVTTEDWFVKVTLSAIGKDGLAIDLADARLEKGGQQFPLARDAQAASRSPAKVALSVKEAKVPLFFEVPEASLGSGLTLVLPGDGADVRLEL
jgi:hypothetical protein